MARATLNITPDLDSLRERIESTVRDAIDAALESAGLAPQDAGDPTGSIVYVTGDSDEWGHTIPLGSAVEIERDDVEVDGSYFVRAVKTGDRDYVGANDVSLESGRSQEIPDGARVKSVDDGTDQGLAHFAGVGTLGEVVGWHDTSAEPWPYSETYVVEFEDGMGGTLTQSVAPESIETPALKKGTDLVLKKSVDAVMAADDGARAQVAEDYFESDRYLNVRWDEDDSRRNGQMHGGYEREDFGLDVLAPYRRELDRWTKAFANLYPRRYVTGVEFQDPAVRTWGEIFRDRPFVSYADPAPEPKRCTICAGPCLYGMPA